MFFSWFAFSLKSRCIAWPIVSSIEVSPLFCLYFCGCWFISRLDNLSARLACIFVLASVSFEVESCPVWSRYAFSVITMALKLLIDGCLALWVAVLFRPCLIVECGLLSKETLMVYAWFLTSPLGLLVPLAFFFVPDLFLLDPWLRLTLSKEL